MIDNFEGCNFKVSVCNSVFLIEVGSLLILIFGVMLFVEDDCEGVFFFGVYGELLVKMFSVIGIEII